MEDDGLLEFHPFLPGPVGKLPEHEGLYIDFRKGLLHGQVFTLRGAAITAPVEESLNLPGELPLRGDGVVDAFREMLLRYGLTAPEAEGLVAAWMPQFFQTEGRRFVLRMSPEEYARQCPIQVPPPPSEIIRLGLVLTEFDSAPTSQPVAR